MRGIYNQSYISAERLERLKGQVEQMLSHNRIEDIRDWNDLIEQVTYHAPSLRSGPSGLQSKLTWPLYELILPWKVRYPHQWFWDSCAHAIVMSHIDLELAMAEIEALLYSQRDDGFIPHMVWNRKKMHWLDKLASRVYPSRFISPYLQPPMLAEAVEAIYNKENDVAFVTAVLPSIKQYFNYLNATRDRSHDGLLEIIISYESGKDRSPEYDKVYGSTKFWPLPVMRLVNTHRRLGWDIEFIIAHNSFRVKDLLFNCVYAQNLMALGRLCEVASDGEAELFQKRAERTEASILSQMYDKESGLFFSIDARSGKEGQIKVNTVSALLPLILDTISQTQVDSLVNDYLTKPTEFWTNYPVPAEPVKSPKRGKQQIWRGQQTWVYTNWFIVKGLRKQAQRFLQQAQKYRSIAETVVNKTCMMVEQEGFREYYDSVTGEGCRAIDFGWSALVLDMIYDS